MGEVLKIAERTKKDNVVQIYEVKEKKKQVKKEVKLKKDGTPKKTRSNHNDDDRTVEPIKDKKDIEKIKAYLQSRIDSTNRKDYKQSYARDLMMFICGINIGLRVSDLLALKWVDIFEGDLSEVRTGRRKKEIKTKKGRTFYYNQSFEDAIQNYINEYGDTIKDINECLFTGRNNRRKPIGGGMVDKMVKCTMTACNIKGNYSTHSLRKTFAYHLYIDTDKDIALVQDCLNHSSVAVTRKYLGISEDEKRKAYLNLNL